MTEVTLNLMKNWEQKYKNLEFVHKLFPVYEEYLSAMYYAQTYAFINRNIIINKILQKYLGYTVYEENIVVTNKEKYRIDCAHNYIDLKHKIIRKGAISAQKDEECLIPFNMRDGLIIAEGKGNSKYNYSAPHGAGRILSRKKAKDILSLESVKSCMKGIYTTSLNENIKDEAPQAYKDKDFILRNIQKTVKVIDYIKPIYNFKATE